MAGSAAGILGSLRIVVDADTSRAQATLRKLGGIGGVVGGAIGTGLGIAGVAALKIGDEYNDALKAIRIGTGATGDQLEMLEADFKAVAGRVPQDLATVGQAVADVNTRTGQTGAGLQALSQSFLDMGRLMDGDVSSGIESVTRLYGDWSVATEDQIATNDLLLRAAQATGVTIDGLAQQMVQFGAPLRNLGYDLADGVAMLSKWEKEGVNTTLALGGLKQALGRFAKEGKDVQKSTEALFESIKDADDATWAMAEGVRYFGSRAGPDMVAAIREGRFEFADFADELASGTETVQGLSDDTRTFGDTIRVAMNKVKVAIGPVTDGLAGIADAMGNAIFLLPAMAGALGNALGRLWTKAAATGAGKAAAAAAGAAAGAVYSAAAAVVGKLRAVLVAAWAAMGGGRLIAAAAAAGTKAGAAYAAASAVAMKAGMLVKAGWAAAGTAIGGVLGTSIAAAALPIIAVALAALAAKMTIDLAHNVGEWQAEVQKGADEAVNQAASEAIKNLENLTKHMNEVQGLGRMLGDTFGGEQEASGLLNLARAISLGTDMTAEELQRAGVALEAAAHEAGARGNEAVQEQILMVRAQVLRQAPALAAAMQTAYDPLSTITVPAPSVAAPIREEFRLATAAVAAGFGSIKQALANPPQMIGKDDRLANMAKRMKKVMANIKKATEVGDPMAQRYWEKARAKQQMQIDRLRSKTVASTKQVKNAYKNAGVDVGKTWDKTKTKTTKAADQAADGTIASLERIRTWLMNTSLTAAGTSLMSSLAAGIAAASPAVIAAVDAVLAEVRARTQGESPPPKGPLSRIDEGGRKVMLAWLDGVASTKGKASRVGSGLAAAVAPSVSMGAIAMGAAGRGSVAMGGDVHVHIGKLYGGPSGLRQLSGEIDRAIRPTMRQRRLNNLSEG